VRVEFCGDNRGLLCPRCGGNYLHQKQVTVFDREEDAETTSVTTVAGGLAATHLLPSEQIANPSGRRHGLAIAFECEGCGDGIELTIAQHKGVTNLGWRVPHEAAQVSDVHMAA
jgi:hypothetical protein